MLITVVGWSIFGPLAPVFVDRIAVENWRVIKDACSEHGCTSITMHAKRARALEVYSAVNKRLKRLIDIDIGNDADTL